MKIYNQLKVAMLESLTATPTQVTAGRIWYRTDNNQVNFSTGTVTKVVADLDTTQTLSNKTLSAPAITNYFDVQEQPATPAAPGAGFGRIYRKDNGKWYSVNSAGLEVELGSGGGSGGINYISNPNAENDTSGWVLFSEYVNNSATQSSALLTGTGQFSAPAHGMYVGQPLVVTVVSGTITGLTSGSIVWVQSIINTNAITISLTKGGSAFIAASTTASPVTAFAAAPYPSLGTGGVVNTASDINFTRSTVNKRRGSASFLFEKKFGNKKGMGVSFDYEAPDLEVDQIAFEYKVVSGTLLTGDLRVYCLDLTTNTLIEPTARDIEPNSVWTNYRATFQTLPGSTQFRFTLYCATDFTTAYSVAIDTVAIGPEISNFGDYIVDEYVYNSSGLTTANTTNATAFATGEEGAAFGNIVSNAAGATAMRVKFSDAIRSTDQIFIEIKPPTDNTWTLAGQSADISGWHNSAGFAYGIGLLPHANVGEATVYFGNYGRNTVAATYGAVGQPWSGLSTWRWRVRRRRVIKNVVMSSDNSGIAVAAAYYGTPTSGVALSSSWSNLTYPTKWNDSTNSYNSGTFVVPVTDYYDISAGFAMSSNWSSGHSTGIGIQIDGSVWFSSTQRAWSANWYSMTPTVSVNGLYLKQGQTVRITGYGDGPSPTFVAGTNNFFSIRNSSTGQKVAQEQTVSCRYLAASGPLTALQYNTITLNVKEWDTHGMWNGTEFTAPCSGEYEIKCYYRVDAHASGNDLTSRLAIDNVTGTIAGRVFVGNGWPGYFTASAKCKLLKGKKIKLPLYPTNAVNISEGWVEVLRTGNY